MIFVTIGTQLPFDRLINIVDQWCEKNPNIEVFAQIGPSSLKPKHMKHKQFLQPIEFNEYFNKAEVIIAHAGMGTIITALGNQKPLIIFPRNADLGEHRNQHQLSTCERFKGTDGCSVAKNEDELLLKLSLLNSKGGELNNKNIQLCSKLREYVWEEFKL